MLQGTYGLILSACGVSIQTNVTREAKVGIEPVDTDLSAGKAGMLGTRTGDDSGVVTLSEGHGVQTGNKVDLYDTAGAVVRYGLDATVAGNDVTLDGGEGDALPAQGAAVVVSVQVTLDVTFDGDNLVMIGAQAERRSHLQFVDAGGATLEAVELGAGEAWAWVADTGAANPLSGNAVAAVKASCGESEGESNIKLTGLQYAA